MADINDNPEPVDPAVDPAAEDRPSEVVSGFYDDTPIPEQEAIDQELVGPPAPEPALDEIQTSPTDTDAGAGIQRFDDGSFIQTFDDGSRITGNAAGDLKATPAPVSPGSNPLNAAISAITGAANGGTFSGALFDTNSSAAAITQALQDQARQQQTLSQQRKTVNNGDWRVKLKLAPGARYLYNAPNPGILQPLQVTDGIIFPYTPNIATAYKANYNQYDLTHSNYRGYFYQNSYVEPVNLNCTFTAQGTSEANYLLAVITFFKSVTKMFYGQDAERGAPPPLVYLSGLGEYQFNEHPCLVSQFNLNLPADVNYIRAGSDNVAGGLNLVNQRSRQNVATASLFGGLNRLAAAFLTKGAIPNPLAPPSLGLNSPTYVPTKMEISIILLPVQSRQQVSKQFSVKEFSNGNLIKGGFW